MRRRVVLPDPRKPVTIVTGMGAILRIGDEEEWIGIGIEV